MPHYVPAPHGPAPEAHGLILGRLLNKANAALAMAGIKAIVPPASLTIATISHFEDPTTPGGGGRPPGDRIGVFVNATAPLQSAAAHAAMDQLVLMVTALGPANGPKYFNQLEHY